MASSTMKQEYTLRAIYEGQGEVGRFRNDLKSLGKIESIKSVTREMRELNTRFVEAKKELREQARAMANADTVTKEMTKSYAAQKREVASLYAALQKKKAAFAASTDAAKAAGINTKDLVAEEMRLQASAQQTGQVWAARRALGVRSHKDISEEVAKLQLAYANLKNSGNASAAELIVAEQRLKQKTAELTAETNIWAGSYAQARNGVVAMAGIGLALVSSFKEFSTFETGMAEVNTLLDVSAEKFKSFKAETKDIVGNLPQDSKDLTKALYDIVSAGVDVDKANQALELSGRAATAGVTDTKTAVNAGLAAMNAYGKSVDDLEGIYDVLFQTVKLGVTTFPELSQNIGDVLPTARAADVGLKDVAGSIATLTKAGIKTPQAATALRGAILAMAAPAPEAKKKFQELGITWKGLLPTLEAIAKKGLSIDQMRELIPDQEAAKGILSLTQNMDVLRVTLASMENAGGSMQVAYQKMADTPEQDIKRMMKAFSELGVEIGSFVSMVLTPLATGLTWTVKGISEADGVTGLFLKTMGLAAAAGLVWKLGLGDIVKASVAMTVGLKSNAVAMLLFQGTVGQAKAALAALTAAAAANPVLAGMTAIVLAGAAAWAIFGRDSLEASKKHAETAKSLGESRKQIDGEVASLEKLQQILKDTAPDSEAHLQAERELAKILPGANLSLDEQGRMIAKVGDAAAVNSQKLAAYIEKLKGESRSTLALQVEAQAKAYAEADRSLQGYKDNLQNWYGIGEQGDDFASSIWRGVNKLTGTYDKNIKKGEEIRANVADQKKSYQDLLDTLNKTGLSADDLSQALDDAHVSMELKEKIIADYRKFGAAIASTGTDAEKAAEKQQQAFRSAAAAIKDEYLKLAEKIKSTLADIATRQRAFASEVRAMNRDGLSGADAWKDMKTEADEYASAAQQALSQGNYEQAIKLADQAKDKYKELNTEVKNGEQVVKTEAEARKAAVEGMTQANDIAIAALEKRNEQDKEAAKNLEEQIGDFKTGWHDAFETFLSDGKESIKQLESALDALTSKKRSIDISVSSSESHASGGIIGLKMATGGAVALRNMLRGGSFPGFGGGDRRHVIAEDGEYMFDKYRVRDAGIDVVREFHRGNYAYVIEALLKRVRAGARAMHLGGMVEGISRTVFGPQYMAGGGQVVAATEGSSYTASFHFTDTSGQTGRVYGQEIDIKRLEAAVNKSNRYRSSNR